MFIVNVFPEPEQNVRIWQYIEIGNEDECWEWRIAVNNKGYGRTVYKGKQYLVPRLILFGLIPSKLITRHTCDNPRCCNPRHLIAGTYRDNVFDALIRGRKKSGRSPEWYKLFNNELA